jgi:hypothetical protein
VVFFRVIARLHLEWLGVPDAGPDRAEVRVPRSLGVFGMDRLWPPVQLRFCQAERGQHLLVRPVRRRQSLLGRPKQGRLPSEMALRIAPMDPDGQALAQPREAFPALLEVPELLRHPLLQLRAQLGHLRQLCAHGQPAAARAFRRAVLRSFAW